MSDLPYPGYVYQAYPKFVYRSVKRYGGKIEMEGQIVQTKQEHEALGKDWGSSPEDAIQRRETLEELVSTAAAERAFSDQKLSKKAQKEMKAREAATGHHVPE